MGRENRVYSIPVFGTCFVVDLITGIRFPFNDMGKDKELDKKYQKKIV